MNLFIAGLGGSEIMLVLVLGIIPLIAWIWTLIKIIRSDFKNPNDKLMWVIIVCILGFIGAIIYFIWGDKNRIRNNYA
jgi:uncharacterized membrane protein